MQTTIIEQRLQRDLERSEAFRLYEEKTDIGERLSLPIHNTPRLEVMNGGVYGYDVEGSLKRMIEWSAEAYAASCNDPAFSGVNSVECLRRKIEDDEAHDVEGLVPGECLLAMSPIPDCVMQGQTTIDGYRTDLARTFYRAYYRHDDHVETMTLSLEQSNKIALKAVGEVTGMRLPSDMQSEAVLSARSIHEMTHESFVSLADTVRYHYDKSLHEQTGEVFFAGNKLAGSKDSMRFINDNHDIIDEHMEFLRSIEARLEPSAFRDTELEKLRQRTAAALDERLHGGRVGSIGDNNVSDRMGSQNYQRECATGATQTEMGLAQGRHVTNCPLCRTQGVTATVRGETITCSDCKGSVDICTGKVSTGKPKKDHQVSQVRPVTRQKTKPGSKQDALRAKYGDNVTFEKKKGIGTEYTIVLNAAGEVIAKV